MIKTFLILATVAVTACAPPPPHQFQNTYNPAEYTAFQGVGKGSVTGQAFMRQRGGGVVTCAGTPVMLVPATPLTREVMAAGASGANLGDPKALNPSGIVMKDVAKLGKCDAQGNFSFSGVKPGNWLVATAVTWTVADWRQGGMLWQEIAVQDNQTTQVLLSE